MGSEMQTVFDGQTAQIDVAGYGPVNVTVSVYGAAVVAGYNPPGTAMVEYYDPIRGATVKETHLIGGGYSNSLINVTVGSLISSEDWRATIKVTPIDNFDGIAMPEVVIEPPGLVGRILEFFGVIDDGIAAVYSVNGYSVAIFSSQPAFGGGVQTNVSYPPGYLAGLGLDPSNLGPLYEPVYDAQGNFVGIDPSGCFPARTKIRISETETKAISEICVGDTVMAFDPAADFGRGALVSRKVTRLYRNVTDEWLKLRWTQNGEVQELIATPGHHFLDRLGSFQTIDQMIEAGRATVVLASGELTEVNAERIVYSDATAHLFERAEVRGVLIGNTALKPVAVEGWQTYNFEVEDLHTYVAGGVRVHNKSGFFGEIGNLFSSGGDRLEHGGFVDAMLDGISNSFHAFGEFINGVVSRIEAAKYDDQVNGINHYNAVLGNLENPTFAQIREAGGYAELSFSQMQDLTERALAAGQYVPSGGVSAAAASYGAVPGQTSGSPSSNIAPGQFGAALADFFGFDGHFGLDGTYGSKIGESSSPTSSPRPRPRPDQGTTGQGGASTSTKDYPKAHETGKDKYGNDTPSKLDTKPIVLDLDGDGIEITDLTKSTQFQADDEGLKHRLAWAGAGDGVLFIDADGNGAISDLREYVFTEWDPASGDDMEALRRVFDTNGDGKLTSADARFAEFRVLVTAADGSTSTKTLAQLGITEIDLRADATKVVLQDGSQITGQTTFVMGGNYPDGRECDADG